jgi:hypothetical protein
VTATSDVRLRLLKEAAAISVASQELVFREGSDERWLRAGPTSAMICIGLLINACRKASLLERSGEAD